MVLARPCWGSGGVLALLVASGSWKRSAEPTQAPARPGEALEGGHTAWCQPHGAGVLAVQWGDRPYAREHVANGSTCVVKMHVTGAGSCEPRTPPTTSRGARAARGTHKPLRAPEMQGAARAGYPWPAMGPLSWRPWKGLLPAPHHSHGLCVDCLQCFALQKNTVKHINIHLLFSQLICPSVHVFIHLYLSIHPSPVYMCPFSSVAQSCLTLCNPMDYSTPGFPVHHQLPELSQTHVHLVSDAIQPSHPLSYPSPPAFTLSQYQGLFQ